ncbi:biotin--[acetyl-CoA-carboxylase] ligase [Thiomicrorhabdus indica]|uniref:biotin--[acetyl-CoA-carboxylase] ligase n=1 Tax=Thiomicrorhabdus indica TaxID=2267253 RepID=UPI002AA71683|nr:biotin--[acetyl-CoA-carboxylase] ligase [Thiomicrorhabdus indica]
MQFSDLKRLLTRSFPEFKTYLLDEIDSTNRFLKTKFNAKLPERSVCITQHQTAGYGQQQRAWESDNESWTFSFCLPIQLPIQRCAGLSSVIGLAIIDALSKQNQQGLLIKWPNDIWNTDGKVAGILIESVKIEKNKTWMVFGIGMNISYQKTKWLPAGKDYPFSSIQLCKHSEELVFISVLENIFDYIQNFESNGFQYFMESFKKLDKFKDGQSVIVYDSGTPIKGVYRGVNMRGEVEIELGGNIKTYCSGSVSIRPN